MPALVWFLAAYVGAYWLLTIAAHVVPIFAASYGSTVGEVLTDVFERMGRAGHINRRHSDDQYWRAHRAGYAGRVRIDLRLSGKAWRRGKPALALLYLLDAFRDAVFGPFGRVVGWWIEWPITRLLRAFGEHVERRHIVGRTLGQDLLMFRWTLGAWFRLWREHWASRPSWQRARGQVVASMTPTTEPRAVSPQETASLTLKPVHTPPSPN